MEDEGLLLEAPRTELEGMGGAEQGLFLQSAERWFPLQMLQCGGRRGAAPNDASPTPSSVMSLCPA